MSIRLILAVIAIILAILSILVPSEYPLLAFACIALGFALLLDSQTIG